MGNQSQDDIRNWIREVAANSEPLRLDDIMAWPAVDPDPLSSAHPIDSETFEFTDPVWEKRMSRKRLAGIAAVVTAVVALVAFIIVDDGGSNGKNVAADNSQPAATTSLEEQTTTTAPRPTPAQVGTAFWQALSAGDREATLALVDPTALESASLSPFGRARTLEGQFDWYEAVDWKWELNECVARDDESAACTATGSNAWSKALDVEPITGTFVVRVGQNGITAVVDQPPNSFASQWSPQVFEIFAQWVDENDPENGPAMFDFSIDINPEILDLYKIETARFVEAQQAE